MMDNGDSAIIDTIMNRYQRSNVMIRFRFTAIFCCFTILVLGAAVEVFGHGYRYGDDSITAYPPLKDYLATTSNYKLLPQRNGQPILRARHRQFGASCGIFSISPIIEYMGYARYTPGASFSETKQYLLYEAGILILRTMRIA